ncbi:MAG: hypothetical protein WEB33_03000 [Bacteroidota bacterium]
MNAKAVNTARSAAPVVTQKDKDAAKQCLILADKFLKESSFAEARGEVAKAQKLDPTNPYAYAFLDRISYFEEQKKKEVPKEPPAPQKIEAPVSPSPYVIEAPKVEPRAPQVSPPLKNPEPKAETIPPKPTPPQVKKEPTPPPVEKKPESPPPPKPVTPPVSVPKPPAHPPPPIDHTSSGEIRRPKAEDVVESSRSVIADVLASRTKPPAQANPPGIADMLQGLSQSVQHHTSNAPRGGDVDTKLDEMKRQIEMLTNALEQERKVREEMNQQQLKGVISQVRSGLEKAWANGAPKNEEIEKLHDRAVGLGIPEDVINTLNREVKLDMYSKAVKEVVSKQNLLRNSSRTLEWLRKVYQVSLDEYLEYESKFLMDLVADQYKGTILLVSGDEKSSKQVSQRLKSMGYAVVNATSPENALEKIEKINPHFILCEMEFSQGYLSGIKFLHVLRANSKFNYIPFILMCLPNEVSQLSSDLRPTEGYIQKPFEMEGLNGIMNEKLMAFRQYLSSL